MRLGLATFLEVKSWIEIGLKPNEYLLAYYLRCQGYTPNQTLNLSEIRDQFEKDLVEVERKVIWQINEENVTLLIANNESNWNKHREANDLVNDCLRLLRMSSGSGPYGGSQPEVRIYLPYLRGLKSFIERKNVDKKQDVIYVMNKQIKSEELSERVTSHHKYQYQVEQQSYGFFGSFF